MRRAHRGRPPLALWLIITAQLALQACVESPESPGQEPKDSSAPEVSEASSPDIPAHPSQLEFPPLEFTPPRRADHRHELASGPVVFVVEDHTLPLVDVEVVIRAGSYLEPAPLAGLASTVGAQMRAGGTERLTPEEFDEEVAFLAAQISASIGDTQGSASLNCLAKDLDRVLDLFIEMLRSPRFDESRLELHKSQTIQALERRNDSTASIAGREWTRLLRGADHFTSEHRTQSSVEAITRETLLGFHRQHVHPGNFVIAVSGDVTTDAILAKLEERLADWPVPEKGAPPVPAPDHEPEPGVYLVDKPDVNQSRVALGHLGVRRGHPDHHALLLANHILGGGGFVSRITSRVRSDEGLAYTARSVYDFGVYYEGMFQAYFQTKNESVAQAIAIVKEEIERDQLLPRLVSALLRDPFPGGLDLRRRRADRQASRVLDDLP